MLRKLITASALLVATPAFAEQPDPALLQRALQAMQAQRNQAMDAAAIENAKAAGLADDLAKANARIKELEPAPKDSKK